ncbi:hypothetical protein K504DRAFT_503266 [Pleomassaria siparia CBS 279.74]|uniref:C2H2-type domain-containing protein n=1 Tax=Pleomassaria siparia CBS 279.74 TaxID=1314801 RepID=A0A6G1K5B9_9PLEO|nr:hypothetical protein K504DRAFT_503266 [Pleomassaria siparia CBS 279.74]
MTPPTVGVTTMDEFMRALEERVPDLEDTLKNTTYDHNYTSMPETRLTLTNIRKTRIKTQTGTGRNSDTKHQGETETPHNMEIKELDLERTDPIRNQTNMESLPERDADPNQYDTYSEHVQSLSVNENEYNPEQEDWGPDHESDDTTEFDPATWAPLPTISYIANQHTDPSRKPGNCHYCGKGFPLGNQLHKHIRKEHRLEAEIYTVQPHTDGEYTPQTPQASRPKTGQRDKILVVKSAAPPPIDNPYTYRNWYTLRLKASGSRTGNLVEVTPDTGAAYITLYIPSRRNTNETVFALWRIRVYVVENLKPDLLLGMDTLVPQNVIIDLDRKLMIQPECQNVTAEITLHPKNSNPTQSHKITAKESTLIPARSAVLVPIHTVRPLLKEHDYLMELMEQRPYQARTYRALINHNTTQVMMRNDGPELIRI